jgi:hypothetical protein
MPKIKNILANKFVSLLLAPLLIDPYLLCLATLQIGHTTHGCIKLLRANG